MYEQRRHESLAVPGSFWLLISAPGSDRHFHRLFLAASCFFWLRILLAVTVAVDRRCPFSVIDELQPTCSRDTLHDTITFRLCLSAGVPGQQALRKYQFGRDRGSLEQARLDIRPHQHAADHFSTPPMYEQRRDESLAVPGCFSGCLCLLQVLADTFTDCFWLLLACSGCGYSWL